MFSKLKKQIKELAQNAVFIAEDALGSKKGQEKKEMAINYVINNIPVFAPFKPLIAAILSTFIDETVEIAVSYLRKEEIYDAK